MKRVVMLFACLMMCAAPAWAKFETASVVGTVRDNSGGAVPGTKVTLTNAGTGVSVEKESNGEGPAAVEGTDEEKRRAFRDALVSLRRRLELFTNLPLEGLSKLAIQEHLNRIGKPQDPADSQVKQPLPSGGTS